MSRCSMTCAPRASGRQHSDSVVHPDLSVRPPSARIGDDTPGRGGGEALPGAGAERLADAAFVISPNSNATFKPLLLGWLRDANQKQPLRDIAVVIERLQLRAGLPAVEQLFGLRAACWRIGRGRAGVDRRT